MPKGTQAIYTQTVGSGGTATIIFNNIPQTYTDLKILFSGRCTTSNAPYQNDNVYLRFNGDSSSVYSATILYSQNSTTVATVRNVAGTGAIYGGTIPTSNAASNIFGNIEIDVYNYKSTLFKSVMNNCSASTISTTTDYNYQSMTAGLYRSNTPVTSISLGLGPTLAQYSTATLYGISR